MNKISLILSDSEFTSFDQVWLQDLLNKYFNVQYIEHNTDIDHNAIFVSSMFNRNKWFQPYIESGHKLLIDNLWEMPCSNSAGLVLTNKNWFWYNESIWYRHLGYHKYIPNRHPSKTALLLMNLRKVFRDNLYNSVIKDSILYSYAGMGVTIAGDIDRNDPTWQRYVNPDWYDATAFSLVSETTIQQENTLFVTEKTFKPIAFQHPFIVYGQAGVLEYLHQLGFETFENIFDESYDTEQDNAVRLSLIANQVNNYTHRDISALTLTKLKHNHELFFNEELVKDRIIKEIIEPILEYAETR